MGLPEIAHTHLKQQNFTEVLLVGVICTVALWYLQFLWKRRELYKTSYKLPGPLSLPFIGSVFVFLQNPNDVIGILHRCFNEYPGLFSGWYGTRQVYCVSDPKYIKIILSSPHALEKASITYRVLQPMVGFGLLTGPVSVWKKHRKIITPTFNQNMLNQFTEVFVEQSAVFNKVLENYTGKKEIDILHLMTKCTLDIIMETAIGVRINAQITNSDLPKWIDRALELSMLRAATALYFFDIIFKCSTMGKEFYYANNKLRSFTMKVIKDKRIQYERKIECEEMKNKEKETNKRKAFLDLLIEMNYEDGHHRFTDNELYDETITFIIAGADTTASTNCFTLTMLGLHQDVQEKVFAEILEVIGPDRKVEVSDLVQLKYLEQVIKETLRIFPIGPMISRDVNADIDLGDYVLHKGSTVILSILRAHRNEKYWPDPYKFDPDRFLPEEMAKRTPGCYIPFSFGPRNCIGVRYAMMAMKTVIATVLRKYRIHTSYKSIEEIEIKPHMMVRPKDGFKLMLELRT